MKKLLSTLPLLLVALPVSAELINIDDEKLQALIEDGTPVVDVRRADEWRQTGVIEGSHLLTFFDKIGRYDAPAWFDQLSSVINPDEPFVLICHSGVRSNMIGKWLGEELDTVYNVDKGIVRWLTNGRKTVAAKADSKTDKSPAD